MSARQRTTLLRSSGSYLPPQVVTNEMLSRIMDTTDEWIVPRTGIRERRFVERGVGPAELAEHAARAALEKAALPPAAMLASATIPSPDQLNTARAAVKAQWDSVVGLDIKPGQ